MEYSTLIKEVNAYYKSQGLKGMPPKTHAELIKAKKGAREELDKLLDAKEGYWASHTGQKRGTELIAIFLVYTIANTIAVEVGRKSGVAVLRWVTRGDEAVCDECWALAGDYDPDGPLPEKPHYGCRCRVVLIWIT